MAHSRLVITKLRSLMLSCKPHLSAYIIPSTDAHQSEYIPDHAKRRGFICGFTGSAGTAVVTEKSALLWTDGRYFLQAAKELSDDWTLMKDGLPGTPSVQQWLHDNLADGQRVGMDPTLCSVHNSRRYKAVLAKKNIQLHFGPHNLVDAVWGTEQPPRPVNAVRVLPLSYTGQKAINKLANLRHQLKQRGCAGTVISSLDEICWLFNIRGADIEYNPVVVSYAFVGLHAAFLFVHPKKLSPTVLKHCADIGVVTRNYNDFRPFLRDFDAGRVYLDVNSTSVATLTALQATGAKKRPAVEEGDSLLALPKSLKNNNELRGMRNAHVRDGVAMVRWLAWLELELQTGRAHTECSLAQRLRHFRALDPLFVGLSFETISGFAANGAIIHYAPDEATCARVKADNSMYLCDSGGQYLDGTTDITRTLILWSQDASSCVTPAAEKRVAHMKRCWTRVMQGHIALATAAFVEGTKGSKLDVLARMPLWRDGLDYNHGTGHGVGCHLNVHEGPHGISSRARVNEVSLQPGMTVTDEPGYYEAGAFGIRHENVLVVRKRNAPHAFNGKTYLEFENITVCPFQTSAACVELMTDAEVSWLNSYNQRCREVLLPLLTLKEDTDAKKWLLRETQPLRIRESKF